MPRWTQRPGRRSTRYGVHDGLRAVRIDAAAARVFFDHPTQRSGAMVDPADLTDEGYAYFACSGVCGVFHDAPWPRVIMGHFGVVPGAWGYAIAPAKAVLNEAWDIFQPVRIIGWTKENNRAALAFTRQLGFTQDGRLELPEPVIMQGWSP